MSIQSNIATSFRPQIAVQPRTDQVPDSEVRGDEVNHRQSLSAPEQSMRSVVSRLDSLNARLNDITVAAKGISLPAVAGPADLAAGAPGLGDGFKARHAESVTMQQAVQGLLDQVETSKVSAHRVYAELCKLAALDLPSSPETEKLSRSFADDTARQARGLPGAPPQAQNNAKTSNDFFAQLLAMIGFIKGEYLAIYEALLTKYSDFYKEFNETVMAKMGDWITGKDDGKKVEIKGGLFDALKALKDKYTKAPAGVLYPIPGAGSATHADASKWAKAMGVPESCVKPDGNGGYRVMMDLSPLDAMMDALPSFYNVGKTETWDSAKFQAWQTGFNSQEGDLKNQLQLFTTKYSNANSYHENFNKILSSQLSQYAEMLKAIASGIA